VNLPKDEPRFDIFFGPVDRYAVWVESVCGLANARERMEALAAQKRGIYFLFSNRDHTILALIDTSPPAAESDAEKKDIA
jgi:hypothetical protein